jgi:integral membrane protein
MVDQMALTQTADGLEHDQLKRLEIFSIVEASTLVLLACVAVPMKHLLDWPLGSRILGPVQGIAFLSYSWTALQTVAAGGWRRREIARLFVVAFVPFAGYFNIPWLRRKSEALMRKGPK